MEAKDMSHSSALVRILRGQSGDDELMAAVAVDTAFVPGAPVGEGVRIDVDAFSELTAHLDSVLGLLGTLQPIFPESRHLIGVVKNTKQGRVIFLPEPGKSNRPN